MKPGDYIRVTVSAFLQKNIIGVVDEIGISPYDGRVVMIVAFGPAAASWFQRRHLRIDCDPPRALSMVYTDEAELVTDKIEIAAAKLVHGI